MTTKEERIAMMNEVFEQRQAKKQAALTVEVYHELKAQKMSDKDIRKKFGMHNMQLYEWKRKNGLVNSQTVSRKTEAPRKPQQAVQQAERDESMKHSQEELEGVKRKLEELQTDYETMKLKHNSATTDLENAKAELIEAENARASLDSELSDLEQKYAKLVEENASLQEKKAAEEIPALQQQIWKLQEVNERLHGDLETQQAEYYKLSNDYRDLHGENERLKRMLGRLKNTERMNLWMMEQYVDMHKQVDEVMG